MKTTIAILALSTSTLFSDTCGIYTINEWGLWHVSQYVYYQPATNNNRSWEVRLRSEFYYAQADLDHIEYRAFYYGEGYQTFTYALYEDDNEGQYWSDLKVITTADLRTGITLTNVSRELNSIGGLPGIGFGSRSSMFRNSSGELIRNIENRHYTRVFSNQNLDEIKVLRTQSYVGKGRRDHESVSLNLHENVLIPQNDPRRGGFIYVPKLCDGITWLNPVGTYCGRVYRGQEVEASNLGPCLEGW